MDEDEYNMLKGKTYVIATNWCFPFGGGEEFMFQTMQWAFKLNMHPFWLCFTDAKDNKPFESFKLEDYKFGKILKIPGGFNESVLEKWLKLLKPDFVHHQGAMREAFFRPCKKLRINFLTGFHFWTGAIILNPEYKNIDILKNYEHHNTDPEIEKLIKEPLLTYYTATDFVSKCIEKITKYDIKLRINPASSYNKCRIKNYNPINSKYVTVVNIHKLKGGEILLYLIKNLKNIPFMAVKTEYMSEELDKKIKDAMNERTENDAECIFMDRVDDPRIIYNQTKILLATSLVDETFCRVVNEAMLNGIPILTTGQGNIKYLLGNSGYIIPKENKEQWKDILEKLYFDETLMKKKINESLKFYNNYSEKVSFLQFKQISENIIKQSKERNIMIFTPWCDQGLGIQSRNYANILDDTDYNVSIFAVKPYNANTCLELQKNLSEWVRNRIYYSENDREKVKDIEIINFVKQYNIGKCLLPETCWFRVFEIAHLLRTLNVKCYAIPNMEIVRRDEIAKHRYFHKILCNNFQGQNIFNKHNILNTEYIGYGIKEKLIFMNPTKISTPIKFLFIGGMNAFSRKKILNVCEGFKIACETNKNIKLTCTVQMTNLLEIDDIQKINLYKSHPQINIIEQHLSYKDIIQLYYDHHIFFQCSRSEGLGINFYEATATGTPVITINTPPHNEIIKEGINGWIVDCYYKDFTDNNDALFKAAHFKPINLANKINTIVENFEKTYKTIIKNLIIDYSDRLDINVFADKFLKSIEN